MRAQAGGKDSSASNLPAQNIVPGRMRVFGCIKAEDTEIPDTWEELETSSVSTEVWVFGFLRFQGEVRRFYLRPSMQAPSSDSDSDSRARSRLHKDLQNLNKASRLQGCKDTTWAVKGIANSCTKASVHWSVCVCAHKSLRAIFGKCRQCMPPKFCANMISWTR